MGEVHAKHTPGFADVQCPLCRAAAGDGRSLLRCSVCGALQHEDCTRDLSDGGCAALGCEGAMDRLTLGSSVDLPTVPASRNQPDPRSLERERRWDRLRTEAALEPHLRGMRKAFELSRGEADTLLRAHLRAFRARARAAADEEERADLLKPRLARELDRILEDLRTQAAGRVAAHLGPVGEGYNLWLQEAFRLPPVDHKAVALRKLWRMTRWPAAGIGLILLQWALGFCAYSSARFAAGGVLFVGLVLWVAITAGRIGYALRNEGLLDDSTPDPEPELATLQVKGISERIASQVILADDLVLDDTDPLEGYDDGKDGGQPTETLEQARDSAMKRVARWFGYTAREIGSELSELELTVERIMKATFAVNCSRMPYPGDLGDRALPPAGERGKGGKLSGR